MSFWFLLISCENEQVPIGFASSSEADSEVTWYEDVEPIVQKHCVRCHHETGLSVGDMSDVNDVKVLAPLMLAAMKGGWMPPPTSDPNCRDYYDSEILHVTEESIRTFSKWVNQDYPMGSRANAQQYNRASKDLEEANLQVMMSKDYYPSFTSENLVGNEYRCFVLEHGQTDTYYVNAIHPIIGNTTMLHHLSIDIAVTENIPQEYFGSEGFDCVSAEGVGEMLLGWGPGMTPQRFPEGVGVKIEPTQSFILEMHYNQGDLTAEEAFDRSGIAMVAYDTTETELVLLELGVRDFLIEAGDPDFTASKTIELERKTKVWGVWPHMHNLGAGYEMFGYKDQEEHCLVQGDGYVYESQQNYLFREPITFEQHDELVISCKYNNSESNPNLLSYPPQDTVPGFGTEDEMCEWFVLVSE